MKDKVDDIYVSYNSKYDLICIESSKVKWFNVLDNPTINDIQIYLKEILSDELILDMNYEANHLFIEKLSYKIFYNVDFRISYFDFCDNGCRF